MSPNRVWRTAQIFAAPVLVLAVMELLVRLHPGDSSYGAAPSAVVGSLVELLRNERLATHAAISLGRLFVGVGIGAVLGTLTGLFLAESRTLDAFLSPTFRFIAGIPVVLWMPFCILLFGTDEGFKLALIAISTGLLFHTSVYQTIADTERKYLEIALLYEKTSVERARLVLLPAATGPAFMALRASLAFGWVVLFFLEFAAARQGVEGLGWFVANQRQLGRIEEEYAGLALIGVLAFTVDLTVTLIQDRVMVWSDRARRSSSTLV